MYPYEPYGSDMELYGLMFLVNFGAFAHFTRETRNGVIMNKYRFPIKIVFGATVLLLIGSSLTLAQGTCNVLDLTSDLNRFATQMTEADDPDAVLQEVDQWLAMKLEACGQREQQSEAETSAVEERVVMSFSSSEYGLHPVIGPIDIPSGIYRVTARTAEYPHFISVSVDAVEGQCRSRTPGVFFDATVGDVSKGTERLFATEECRALIAVSGADASWTLEFSQMIDDDLIVLTNVYTSDELGFQPVIGPISFEDGTYKVTATTEGYMSVDVLELDGRCEVGLGFGSIFNLGEGQATNGAEAVLKATKCVALIMIDNTTRPWTLEFSSIE